MASQTTTISIVRARVARVERVPVTITVMAKKKDVSLESVSLYAQCPLDYSVQFKLAPDPICRWGERPSLVDGQTASLLDHLSSSFPGARKYCIPFVWSFVLSRLLQLKDTSLCAFSMMLFLSL